MKSLLLIGAGIQEVPGIDLARAHGWKVIVSDRNRNAPGVLRADSHVIADRKDPSSILRSLAQRNLHPNAVVTFTELTETVQAVSHELGLRCTDSESVAVSQNKSDAYKRWESAGVPHPRVLRYPYEALRVQGFGGEWVAKPQSDAGGRGIYFGQGEPLRDVADSLIVTERARGEMVDGNGYFLFGHYFALGTYIRHFRPDSVVHNCLHASPEVNDLHADCAHNLLEQACRAIDLTEGPVKIDAVATSKQMLALEVAARLHGPMGSLVLLPGSGYSSFTVMLDLLSSESEASYRPPSQLVSTHSSIFAVVVRRTVMSGELRHVLRDFSEVRATFETGGQVRLGLPTSNHQISGYVHTVSRTRRREVAVWRDLRHALAKHFGNDLVAPTEDYACPFIG